MLTKINNILLTTGIAVAILISLNSFQLIGGEEPVHLDSPYYTVKDSLVQTIRSFDTFSELYLDKLTNFDQNSAYRYTGYTNFLRTKIHGHQSDLSSLMLTWQNSDVAAWDQDSSAFNKEFIIQKKEGVEIREETVTFLNVHRNVRR